MTELCDGIFLPLVKRWVGGGWGDHYYLRCDGREAQACYKEALAHISHVESLQHTTIRLGTLLVRKDTCS